jgi:hypothetical protein
VALVSADKTFMPAKIYHPRCKTCGRPSAQVELTPVQSETRLLYRGPGGSNGQQGNLISNDRAQAIELSLTPPYSSEKFKAAEIYDYAGFCIRCYEFYCTEHWNVTGNGGGTCPRGHFKMLDPFGTMDG